MCHVQLTFFFLKLQVPTTAVNFLDDVLCSGSGSIKMVLEIASRIVSLKFSMSICCVYGSASLGAPCLRLNINPWETSDGFISQSYNLEL
jgi:hypothetical protein